MATIDEVQNAMVNVITAAVYPNGSNNISIAGAVVSEITVDLPGTGYTTATVQISGGGGFGAQAVAVITAGQITAIKMINKGNGYTSVPVVVITGTGTGATATAAITNRIIYVYAGDPLKQDLDGDLLAGNINVAVFAQKGMSRDTTRIRDIYGDEQIQTATLSLAIIGDTVTVDGIVTAGQTSVIIVNGVGYAYMALQSDTVDSIAAQLATLIPGATALNNVITIANVTTLEARLSLPGTMRRVLQSQEGIFRVRIITPVEYPDLRDLLSKIIQIAFLLLTPRYYLAMPDGISASVRAKGIDEINKFELALALVRDHLYLIEYHVVDVGQFATIADPYITATVNNLPIP